MFVMFCSLSAISDCQPVAPGAKGEGRVLAALPPAAAAAAQQRGQMRVHEAAAESVKSHHRE